MTTKLSHRLDKVKPSATLAVSAKAAELKAQGINVINLGVGEPDFDTPANIKKAGIAAIENGHTKYTAVDGLPELKKAILNKFIKKNSLSYDLKQIIVSTGAKQVIYNCLQALLNPGDEVIIPAPFWVSYPDMVNLAEGEPVIIVTGAAARFKITPEQLEESITPKTRLLIINSPSNPSGMAYTKAELIALAQVLKKHPDVLIMSDDIYEYNLWSKEPFCNIATACPELQERTIIVNGVSKAYAMTGWRIGYAAGPVELINGMKKIQSQSTSNPNSIAQYAAIEALNGDQSIVNEMTNAYQQRHDFMVRQLNQIPGISCLAGDGTFYAFADVSDTIARLELTDDIEFAAWLLSNAHVACVPGSAFGCPGYVRFSFAASQHELEQAIERVKSALAGTKV